MLIYLIQEREGNIVCWKQQSKRKFSAFKEWINGLKQAFELALFYLKLFQQIWDTLIYVFGLTFKNCSILPEGE